jgi:hypothetical protein
MSVHLDAAWIGTICAVAGVLLSVKPLRWAFRLLIGTHEFLTDWPRMKTDITGLREEVAAIKAETRPNGGNSLRDVVHRTARDVAEIRHEQAAVRTRLDLFELGHISRKDPGKEETP